MLRYDGVHTMSATYEELKEKILREYDADLLLEVLEINAEMLLDRFEDLLMKNMDKFQEDDLND